MHIDRYQRELLHVCSNCTALLCICSTDLLATGDAAGFVQVWKLGTNFSQQGSNEQEALEDIASTENE